MTDKGVLDGIGELNEDKVYEKLDFSGEVFGKVEFVECLFEGCNFSGCDLSQADFMDCRFERCNFALVKVGNSGLKNIRFTGTKIAGVDFSQANDFMFAIRFEACT